MGQLIEPRAEKSTEQRILDAAHTVFIAHGTAGARMQDIAEEAGVNQALLHYYFRNKERLSAAVFRRAASELFPPVIRLLASDAGLEDKVERVVDLYLRQLLQAPYLPGYIISELTHRPGRVRELITALTGKTAEDTSSPVLAALRRQLDERQRAGTLQPIAAEDFMVNLMSLCVFPFAARPMLMAMFRMDQKDFEQFIERRRREIAAFFMRALRP